MIVSLSVSFVKTIKTKSGIWLNLFLHLPLPILHQPLRRYHLSNFKKKVMSHRSCFKPWLDQFGIDTYSL